jgi:arginine decarboxylase
MKLVLCTKLGTGRTELSAFDAALVAAGIGNYNLLPLSSVIPPGTDLVEQNVYDAPIDTFGQRLYVVRAEQRSSVLGEWVGAGIGWTQMDDDRGWFVEHEVVASDRAGAERDLNALIEDSLLDLCEHRGLPAPKVHSMATVAQVVEQPVCALAVAIYASEAWPDQTHPRT